MPGVPSGRGCDACRKQKKKCDLIKPICSRCARLHIHCVGLGVQRYKWKLVHRVSTRGTPQQLQGALLLANEHAQKPRSPSPPLSNDTTHLVAQLTAHLSAVDDVRYNLAWSYGFFLLDIPARLGTSPVLDASVSALLAAHSCFCIHGGSLVVPDALAKYSRALQALRGCLDHVPNARRSDTLAAILVLLICQGLLGYRSGSFMFGDAEGAAQVLRLRGRAEPSDPLERSVLLTLRGPVILQSIANPHNALDPEDFLQLDPDDAFMNSTDHISMKATAHIPSLLRRGHALLSANPLPDAALAADCRTHYATMQHATHIMHTSIVALQSLGPAQSMPTLGHTQRRYAFLLGVTLVFNVLVRALRPGPDPDPALAHEGLALVHALLAVEPHLDRFRPLATAYLAVPLAAAWAALGPEQGVLRGVVEGLLRKYAREFYRLAPAACPRRDLERVERTLWLGRVGGGGAGL